VTGAEKHMNQLVNNTEHKGSMAKVALSLASGAVWRGPRPFGMARLLGTRFTLRCVLFHQIADSESAFTKGLGVTVARQTFEDALKFITMHYTPVSLQEAIAGAGTLRLPRRPVLVTFDDAYATIGEFAAPLCFQYRVPAVFFVNGACLDNRQLAMDNLVCYVANEHGMEAVRIAVLQTGSDAPRPASLAHVFSQILPSMSLTARAIFRDALLAAAQCSEEDLVAASNLYLSSEQLRNLTDFNVEVGNHTYSHVNCRSLRADEFSGEIDRNRTVLESITKTRVRSFSVPYGSSLDLTPQLTAHLKDSGYEALFLAEGRSNPAISRGSTINRVSIKTKGDASLFSEIEILPRLRRIKNAVLGIQMGNAVKWPRAPEAISQVHGNADSGESQRAIKSTTGQ
jgi:peptidoglycan/xylan/chitin deacetylase (PgdA/CDA1 family)